MLAAPRQPAPERQRPDGSMSMVTRTLLIVAPAVLAAAALRPRSNSSRQSATGNASGARS
ncbi:MULTISPECIES: hypothetical protein [Streptomyces]|uniref:hypothetical protein n=1 Tax=Streptomyces TaxID=1883 RepID=UPI0015D4FCB9|nr:hypothetical protein [Streptomyces sp. RK75]